VANNILKEVASPQSQADRDREHDSPWTNALGLPLPGLNPKNGREGAGSADGPLLRDPIRQRSESSKRTGIFVRAIQLVVMEVT
jgi:hypothetical protein